MICLVQVPFGSVTHPSLSLSRLKAQLSQSGIGSRIQYLNFAFAKQIGINRYEWIAHTDKNSQLGESIFERAAWCIKSSPGHEAPKTVRSEIARVPYVSSPQAWMIELQTKVAPEYIDWCANWLIDRFQPRVVGFSCSFYQLNAAVALGRAIKDRAPGIKIIYGGALVHGGAGERLMANAPWIDAVHLGQAAAEIPELFASLRDGREPGVLPGVLVRNRVAAAESRPSTTPSDLLPFPDFSDFFTAEKHADFGKIQGWRDITYLPVDLSIKNIPSMGAVPMPTDYAWRMICWYRRYPVRRLVFTNELGVRQLRELMPRLSSAGFGKTHTIQCEVSATVTRDDLQILASAGVRHISTNLGGLVRRNLRDNISTLDCIRLLKECSVLGITPHWIFWKELHELELLDSTRLQQWIPRIFHLHPPLAGVKGREHYLHPSNIHFGVEDHRLINMDDCIAHIRKWLLCWTSLDKRPQLHFIEYGGRRNWVHDSREQDVVRFELTALDAAILNYTTMPRTIEQILNHLEFINDAASNGLIETMRHGLELSLMNLLCGGLVLEEDGRYLSIVMDSEIKSGDSAMISRIARNVLLDVAEETEVI